jgi:hypothetical protein
MTTFYKAEIQLSLREPSGTDIQVKVLAETQPLFLDISLLLLPTFTAVGGHYFKMTFYSLGIIS